MESKSRNQYIATIFANGGIFAGGLSYGWSSPVKAQLVADERDGTCAYDFCVTTTELAWIASLVNVGSVFLGFIAGPIMSRFGRRPAMMLYMALTIIGWGFLTTAVATWMLYVGRILVGGGFGGACVILPIYIGEIADTAIRGKLLSCVQLSLQSGILTSYILGYFFNINMQNYVSGILVALFGISLLLLPESPRYYVYVNKIEHAKASLRWLRGEYFEPQKLIDEMIEFQNTQQSRELKSIFTDKINLKALMVTLGLIIGVQMCGINPILFYTATIFQDAEINIHPNLAVIFVGIFALLATIASLLLVDIAGRRALLFVSTAVMFICTMIMAIYFHLQDSNPAIVEHLSVLPIVTLCLYLFVNMIGLSPISFIIIGEIFAQNVKDIASSISMIWSYSFSAFIVFLFPFLADAFGLSAPFFLFAIFSAATFFFVLFVVPETKGKSFQEIQSLFLNYSLH